MSELNVEKIMEEIREEIKQKGYTNGMLSFNDFRLSDKFDKALFDDDLASLNNCWEIESSRIIKDKKGIKGFFINTYKKIVRKSIRFYVASIVSDQNNFNMTVVNMMNMIERYMEANNKLADKVQSLEESQKELRKKIEQLSINAGKEAL